MSLSLRPAQSEPVDDLRRPGRSPRRSSARLEMSLAWRYLRSRRGSKLLSLISVIAIGGVTVAVSALIVIIGVMNGLQNDLREKILIGSPDITEISKDDAPVVIMGVSYESCFTTERGD